MMRMNPGSALVTRAGFGVAPKQSFVGFRLRQTMEKSQGKVRDREDAIASTRDACATRIFRNPPCN
jgi:hypothetical protein